MDPINVSIYEQELAHLEADLARPETMAAPRRLRELSRRHAQLTEIINLSAALAACRRRIAESESILQDESDEELRALAGDDAAEAAAQIETLEAELQALLLPPEQDDEADTIMEIRAGTGGDEASLFAAELYRMYSRYAERCGWRIEALDTNATELGGIKEIVFSVQGQDVYRHLKYEAGVHRVQRVPETEASGRIHTSAASVAVLPEPEDVDIEIAPDDLRIDVFRSGGRGGQHVNTTDSAVRITHLPTGVVVSCQDERSQHKNKAKAMRVLKARLLEHARQQAQSDRAAQRKSMVRSGDRSEKIRTYNYPQNRVTDHRIGLTVHALEEVLAGDLDRIITPLIDHDTEERLKALAVHCA
jgi:peptide chain release factor 1